MKILNAKTLHQNWLGAYSHSMIINRDEVLDALDMAIEMFPDAKVTIHYGESDYWIAIEFKKTQEI
jgi:hypothetical protein